jgi:DDE superfamily endonuclease
LALAPRYGWVPKGPPARGKAPTNRGPNATGFAARTHEGLLTTLTVEGAANTEACLTYLDELLGPALRPGKIVLMDNRRVHKAQAVLERIEA